MIPLISLIHYVQTIDFSVQYLCIAQQWGQPQSICLNWLGWEEEQELCQQTKTLSPWHSVFSWQQFGTRQIKKTTKNIKPWLFFSSFLMRCLASHFFHLSFWNSSFKAFESRWSSWALSVACIYGCLLLYGGNWGSEDTCKYLTLSFFKPVCQLTYSHTRWVSFHRLLCPHKKKTDEKLDFVSTFLFSPVSLKTWFSAAPCPQAEGILLKIMITPNNCRY